MSLTKWTRAPDKVLRFGDMPVMLWTKAGDMRAICGEIEIEVYRSSFESDTPFRMPIRGTTTDGGHFCYSGPSFAQEPSSVEFEAEVVKALERLSQTGELYGHVDWSRGASAVVEESERRG